MDLGTSYEDFLLHKSAQPFALRNESSLFVSKTNNLPYLITKEASLSKKKNFLIKSERTSNTKNDGNEAIKSTKSFKVSNMLREMKQSKQNNPSYLSERKEILSSKEPLYKGPDKNQSLMKKIRARLQEKEVNDDFFSESKGMTARVIVKKEVVSMEEQIKNILFASISDSLLKEMYRYYKQLKLKQKLLEKKNITKKKLNENEKYMIMKLCQTLEISIGSILRIPEFNIFNASRKQKEVESTPYMTYQQRKSISDFNENIEKESDMHVGELGELSSLNKRKYETNFERLSNAMESGLLTSTSNRSKKLNLKRKLS